MRQGIKDFVSIVIATLPIREPIYEFGSRQPSTQIGFADLRPLFPGKVFVGVDMQEGPGVDRVSNLHHLDIPAQSVGTALCLDTLEHVEYPHRAMEQIYAVLANDGLAVISSVMDFPIHDHPHDYWRFTPEAFRSLLKPFSYSFVGFAGDELHPHTVVGIGFKGEPPPLAEFNRRYEEWQSIQTKGDPFKETVKQLTPPILAPFFARIYNLGHKRQNPS
jgi:SAM-dependent methyltransferase